MKSLVGFELSTAALRSSQARHAAVDNSAPLATRPESTYKSGKVVQTNGATSQPPWRSVNIHLTNAATRKINPRDMGANSTIVVEYSNCLATQFRSEQHRH